MGYLEKRDPGPWRSRGQLALEEFDTFTCRHHGGIVKLLLNRDPAPGREKFEVNKKAVTWCTRCGGFICDWCRRFACDPVEEKLGRYEKAAAGRG